MENQDDSQEENNISQSIESGHSDDKVDNISRKKGKNSVYRKILKVKKLWYLLVFYYYKRKPS